MTVDEVLEQVERQKPNAVEERLKRDWVLELERRNWEEMRKADASAEPDGHKLGIPPPYDRAYALYVIAMIEFVTQEYAGYENTMALFNSVMDAYKAWYRRKHRPKKSTVKLW